MKTYKIAIIGCGGFCGGQYLPDVPKIPNAKIVAFCDILPDRAKSYAAKAGGVEYYFSIDELLEKCDFDVLMNATSIPAHHEINMKALAAGKHLFTQKPAGLTVEEVTAQIELASKKGLKANAAPVHAMRHSNRKARQLIADGVIGKPTTARVQVAHGGPEYFQYRENHPGWFYEPGSGALYDMGVHGLHYITDLLGSAKEVGCMAATSIPERMIRTGTYDGEMMKTDKLPDNYIITLNFGDGVIGEVYTGFCQRATRMPTMEIYGTDGTISFVSDPGEARPHLEVYFDKPGSGIRGWTRPMDLQERETFFCDSFCLKDLLDAIDNDTQPVLSLERQRHLVDIMCTIPKCIETGRILPLHTSF